MENGKMTKMEKEELGNRIIAMTRQEKKFSLMFYPTDLLLEELARRCNESEATLRKARKDLKVPDYEVRSAISYAPKAIYKEG